EGIRHARGGLRQLAHLAARVLRFHALDAPLDLANVVQVALEPLLVVRTQLATEEGHLVGDPVEDAAVRAAAPRPLLLRGAGAEEHVERDPGIPDQGERLVRRRPADRVRVHAGVAVGAPAGLVDVLDAELHRGNRRALAETVRVELVHRRASEDVRAARLLRMSLRQEDGARAEVVGADLTRWARL